MVYNGEQWNLQNREDVIDDLYCNNKDYIEQNVDDFVQNLTSFKEAGFRRWLETNDDNPKILKLKERIKLLLYNNRKIVLKNIK